jgi:hypothetical protein
MENSGYNTYSLTNEGVRMKSKEFAIDRVKVDLSFAEFEARFYLPQKPAILEGATRNWRALERWTPRYLQEKVEGRSVQQGYSAYRRLWFDVDDSVLGEDYHVPSLVSELRRRPGTVFRDQPVRVWMSVNGMCTPWHYDGNGVQGLNVQVRGKKRFTLVSPETPLPCLFFDNTGRHGFEKPSPKILKDRIFTVGELLEGDMVFVPQHWFHYVESIGDLNLNVNWVWTDLAILTNAQTPVSVRERQCLTAGYRARAASSFAGADKLSSLPEYLIPSRVEGFGGKDGFDLCKVMIQGVSTTTVAKRWVRELLGYPASEAARRKRAREGKKNYSRFDHLWGSPTEPRSTQR